MPGLILTFTGQEDSFQRLQLQIIGAVAEFERSMIRERQREGIAIAKAAGKYTGRKPSLSNEQVEQARRLVAEGYRKVDIAKRLNVSRTTLYHVLADTRKESA